MARIKRMAWGTVARWLESAAIYAQRFNRRMLRGFVIHELQADEIRTFTGAKKRVIWVLTTLEVWSRLWVSAVVGRRNFRKIKRVILNTLQRGCVEHRFLFTTDGFEMYDWAAKRLLPGICIYGQATKKRLSFRDVFNTQVAFFLFFLMVIVAKQLFFCNLTESDLRSDSPVV